MGTSSGLGFTSEVELKRSNMIIVTFVSVLLLISGSNAQFQVGKCPTTKECEENGGECFYRKCPPRDYERIGPCMSTASRGCVCCKPVIDVGKCPEDPSCLIRGGKCQFPKCEKGYKQIGICRSGSPFECKCCRPPRRG